MKIAVVGTGYVGLSNAVLFAQHHEVVALDVIKDKVDMVNRRVSPIIDVELEDYLKNKPINLKSGNMLVSYPGPKYKKTSFSNPGHAINLAKKLNVLFKTDQFSVVLLQSGDQIFP